LFEKKAEAVTPAEMENIYKKEVDKANGYKCNTCRHRGSIECFPPFNDKETKLESFTQLNTERDLLEKEFVCYHTKVPLSETTLGVGVSLKRAVKSGEVNNVHPTLDLLSNKAFTKEEIRTSLANEPFNYWMPLYFGDSKPYEVKKMVYDEATKTNKYDVKVIDPLQRFQHLLKKKLCFMTKGTTQVEFNPMMAL
jgi:hypothetical protein